MTTDKLKEIADKYIEHSEKWLDMHGDSVTHYFSVIKRIKKVHEMSKQISVFIEEGRIQKAMRWLGFIQGTLWCSGIFSIDELRNHSRGDE